MAAVVGREIAVPVERVIETAAAGFGGALNGALWRFAPLNLPLAMLSTTALAVGSLFGSIWTRGAASAVFGGMASGSVAVLGFVAPLLIGAGTSRKVGQKAGESRVIQTKALPGAAGERVRQKVSDFVELGALG